MGTYQITRLGTHFSICSVPHLCPLSVAITLVLSHVVWGISKSRKIHPLPVWRDVQNPPGPLIAATPPTSGVGRRHVQRLISSTSLAGGRRVLGVPTSADTLPEMSAPYHPPLKIC